ncbi:MAG: hypothetical protein RIT36_802 [Bacteroidota bacterium]
MFRLIQRYDSLNFILYGGSNKKYQSYSVNDEKDIKNMAFGGVDGIISDYPDRFSILKNR